MTLLRDGAAEMREKCDCEKLGTQAAGKRARVPPLS
jgi:hypothetical protein